MDVSRISPAAPPIAPLTVRPTASSSAARAATAAKPAASPLAPAADTSPTTGSTLWDLLTPEEQDFFTRQTALGPLTYGPSRNGRSEVTPDRAPLGGRIDVKG